MDQQEKALNKARSSINVSLQKINKKKFKDNALAISQSVSETMGNISWSTDAVQAASIADLVIESIVEDREIKRNLFRKLDKVKNKNSLYFQD